MTTQYSKINMNQEYLDNLIEDNYAFENIREKLHTIEHEKDNLQYNINELIQEEYLFYFQKKYDSTVFPQILISPYGSAVGIRRVLSESNIQFKTLNKSTVFEESFHWCLYYNYFTELKKRTEGKLNLTEISNFRSTLTEQHYIIGSLVNNFMPECFGYFLHTKQDYNLRNLLEQKNLTVQESRDFWDSILQTVFTNNKNP